LIGSQKIIDLVVLNKDKKSHSANESMISKVHKAIATSPLVYQKNHPNFKDSKEYKKRIYTYSKLNQSDNYGHATDELILELNFFFSPSPIKIMKINSYIYDFLNDNGHHDEIKEFNLDPFELNLLCTTRTFFEKLLSLYRAAHKSEDILKGRIRHLYDLYMLANKDQDVIKILKDDKLLKINIEHTIGDEKLHEMFGDIKDFLPLHESIFSINLELYKEMLEDEYTENFGKL